MCGICGILAPATAARLDDLEGMTRTLDHRGPDDSGLWQHRFRADDEDFALGLGHTRLSILDLSELGHQPMVSGDGSLALTYNGEIYNFKALRTELEQGGSRFRSDCDTEVLLEAYRRWGLDLLGRLVGMFAFALWDGEARRLVLARDRLGIKPLYYRLADGVLTFGSELRALRRHGGFRPEIDRGALGRFLRSGYVSGRDTIYENTHAVLPGEVVLWSGGRLERRNWWSLTAPPTQEVAQDFETAVGQLEGILGRAVEDRMIADVPLGAFLSGGVDSSTVVALMQERSSRPVRTFSIGFREGEYDEAPHAARVAAHLGCDHTELYVERDQARDVAHSLPELYDMPFADSSAIPTVLLSRMTRRHVTVALSGDGGDELFGGYGQYGKLDRLLSLYRLPSPARRLLAAAAPLAPSASLRSGLERLGQPDVCSLAASLVSYFPEDVLAAACGADGARIPAIYEETFGETHRLEPVRRAMLADARVYLPDDILTKVDRASMSVSLEARVPLLDHRVVRWAVSLPTALLRHGGVAKAPLRALLYRRVPRELIERPKRGFGIPIETLLSRELTEWPGRYLSRERLMEEGLFDRQGIDGLVAATRGDRPLHRTRLWILLCFERWYARVHRGERVVSG